MITVQQWRAAIGCFSPNRQKHISKHGIVISAQTTSLGLRLTLFLSLCIIIAGDVETNPGPTPSLLEINENINAKFDIMQTQNSELAKAVNDIKNSMSTLANEQAALRKELSTLKVNVTSLDEKCDVMYADIDAIAESVATVQDRLSSVENEIEKQEQYSRRENVLLYNIEEAEGETFWNIRKKVIDIFNANLGATEKKLMENDIMRAHRLGKGRPTDASEHTVKPRPIIVRFSNFMDKLTVLKTRPALREKGIGLSNDLTLKQRSELQKLKDKGESGYYKNGQLVINSSDSTNSQHGDSRKFLRGARQFEKKK